MAQIVGTFALVGGVTRSDPQSSMEMFVQMGTAADGGIRT